MDDLAAQNRETIQKIERRIIKITAGGDTDKWRDAPSICHVVESLLTERRDIMNQMFRPTDANMRRFEAVNTHLETLCRQLCRRMANIRQSLPLIMDTEVDDDYEIEGELRFCFNDETSVIRLADDDYYGSDFARMISVTATLNYGTFWECIERFHRESWPLDDGVSWDEPPFYGRAEFDNIVICHAMHNLTGHMGYSIPDVIRLNDFWAEVRLTLQSITGQDGARYVPPRH